MARYTFAIFLYYPLFLFFLLGDHRETKREREIVPTPYLLILGGMCLQVSRRYGLHGWRSYFSLAVRF